MTKATKTQYRATCSICFKNHAVHGDSMVDHGYTIPQAWHQRTGSCYGYLKPHFGTEKGREIAADNAAHIRNWAKDRRASAAKVRTNPPASVTVDGKYDATKREYEQISVTKDDHRYASKVESMIYSLESQAKNADADATMIEKFVAEWKPVAPVAVEVETGPTIHMFSERSRSKVLCVWSATSIRGNYTHRHSSKVESEVSCAGCLKALAAMKAEKVVDEKAAKLVAEMTAKHGEAVSRRFSDAANAAVREIRYKMPNVEKAVRKEACRIIEG